MKDFWITIHDLDENAGRTLWMKHKNKSINCTFMNEKSYIYGQAYQSKIDSIVSDIIALGKDYGLVEKDIS